MLASTVQFCNASGYHDNVQFGESEGCGFAPGGRNGGSESVMNEFRRICGLNSF